MTNAKSGAAFFCAANQGASDLFLFLEKGMQDVTLVDNSEEKMQEIKELYPYEWKYLLGDAFETVREMEKQLKMFDVVTAEPWTFQITQVLEDDFMSFYNITSQYLIVLINHRHCVEEFGFHSRPTVEDYQHFLQCIHRIPIEIAKLVQRVDGNPLRLIIRKEGYEDSLWNDSVQQ